MDTFSFDTYEEEETNFTDLPRQEIFPVITPTTLFYPMQSLFPQMPIDQNNCAVRSIFSLIGGGVMGFIFGPFLSGFGSSAMDHDPNLSLRTKVIEVLLLILLLFILFSSSKSNNK